MDVVLVRPRTNSYIKKTIKEHAQKRKDWCTTTSKVLDQFVPTVLVAIIMDYSTDENYDKLREATNNMLRGRVMVYFGEAPLWIPNNRVEYGFNIVTNPTPEYGWCLMSSFGLSGYFKSMGRTNRSPIRVEALRKIIAHVNREPVKYVVINDFYLTGANDKIINQPTVIIDQTQYQLFESITHFDFNELPPAYVSDSEATLMTDDTVTEPDTDTEMKDPFDLDEFMDGRQPL